MTVFVAVTVFDRAVILGSEIFQMPDAGNGSLSSQVGIE